MPTVKRHKHRRHTIQGVLAMLLPLKATKKGNVNRKIIQAARVDYPGTLKPAREFYLHATKGYRSHSA